MAKKRKKSSNSPTPASPTSRNDTHGDSTPDDPMSQCVMLCQQERWREALLLCRQVSERAESGGSQNLAASLAGPEKKIDCSLRRQMAAALINASRDLLAREYLLDVGE